MRLRPCAGSFVVFVSAMALAGPVEAQTKPKVAQTKPKPKVPTPPDTSKWEIEFKARFGRLNVFTAEGSGDLPPAGEAFQTAGNSTTRRVSSWLLGDGSTLLNDVLASFGRSERVMPLDAVLNNPGVDHATESGFGVRLSRRWKPNIWIEVDGDWSPASFTLLPSVVNGLLHTSASFANAFSGLAASAQGAAFLSPQLDSSVFIGDGTGHEIIVTGALVWEIGKSSRFRPYVVGGGGVAVGLGEAAALISSHYTFELTSGGVVDETDTVDIRFAGGLGLVATAGGGIRVRVTRRSGVRVDMRATIVENHVDTLVTTSPVVAQSLPADAIWSVLNPGIQFVTHASTGLQSNLSAPALSNFKTLAGSGFHTRVGLSLGYYFRF